MIHSLKIGKPQKTGNTLQQKAGLSRRLLKGGFARRSALELARQLSRAGAPKIALRLLNHVAEAHPSNDLVMRQRAHLLERLGRPDEALALRATHLRTRLGDAVARRNLTEILTLMARLEVLKQGGLLSAGYILSDRLMTDVGQRSILNSVRKARQSFPDSPFLLHLQSLCQARLGEYKQAHKLLLDYITRHPSVTTPDEKRSFELLSDSWRVVDLAAREQMDWAGEEHGYEKLFEATPGALIARASEPDWAEEASEQRVFKEHALQGRMRTHYLDNCEREFRASQTTGQKLRAISDMLRTGARHIPSYRESYDRARVCLSQIRLELGTFLSNDDTAAGNRIQKVAVLCSWLRLARRLQTGDAEQIQDHLLHLSEQRNWATALLRAPETVGNDPAQAANAALIMSRIDHVPLTHDWQVRSYFRWAMVAGEYDRARRKFAGLASRQKRCHGALHYSVILQRQGEFAEAQKLVRKVHAQLLSQPHLVKAFSTYSLIKRNGELDFLTKTAKIYSTVSQPKDPVGIVLIAPRNIDQLRRYPLIVLRELKQKGWAVIPLVEGLLPCEPTGRPQIDILNGAISANLRFSGKADVALPQVTDVQFRPAEGHMSWNGIDLSHALWEDSAINRRVYSVDFTCPELQIYLTGLAGWSTAMLRVLEYAKGLRQSGDCRIAAMSLFGHRLPDAVFRFYLERFGDPDSFYCVHAANGYQNYFTNFTTNTSERLVLRNITRHREVRSASFPVPEAFEAYYAAHRHKTETLLNRWESVTQVKRSTIGRKMLPPQAVQLRERIAAWRRGGGKVACAFGKVVFDSSVPFDGGPAHKNMRDWINHCVETVKDSKTLLLIKPHPHEINNQIATFPNEYFLDLINVDLNDNVAIIGHSWFDIYDMKEMIDLGLIYNGTTAVELGILGIPCLLSGHFSAIDYPIGHAIPTSRVEFEDLLRFEKLTVVAPDIRQRAAVWLDYMANHDFTQPYRFHSRPVTNKVLYPPVWFDEDLALLKMAGSQAVQTLVARFLGEAEEPGIPSFPIHSSKRNGPAEISAAAVLQSHSI